MENIGFIKGLMILTILIGLLTMPAVNLTKEAMASGSVTLKVLNPRAEVQKVKPVPISPRLQSLEGKKIGLINNTKLGADILQPELEKVLRETIPTVQLRSWVVSHVDFENKGKTLKEIAKASDGIILFLGD